MATVYLVVKFHPDHRNRDLVDRLSSAFEAHDIETVCFARDFELWGEASFEPDEMMRLAFESIDRCSALVVEFSEKGVGVGIEAGYAAARAIPIFVLHPPHTEVSATLQGVARGILAYEDDDTLNYAVRRIVESIS